MHCNLESSYPGATRPALFLNEAAHGVYFWSHSVATSCPAEDVNVLLSLRKAQFSHYGMLCEFTHPAQLRRQAESVYADRASLQSCRSELGRRCTPLLQPLTSPAAL